MPNRIPKICACGCGGETNGDTYLPGHNRKQDNGTDRKAGRNWAAWERLKDFLKSLCNVICQWVGTDGVRCTKPVYIFHHIIEVSVRPDLELNWQNVVGVCKNHHPTPNAKDQGQFTPTLYRTPMSDEPLPLIVAAPGQKVPKDLVLWTRENRLELFK